MYRAAESPVSPWLICGFFFLKIGMHCTVPRNLEAELLCVSLEI